MCDPDCIVASHDASGPFDGVCSPHQSFQFRSSIAIPLHCQQTIDKYAMLLLHFEPEQVKH
jgi:hypothetical protein